MNPQLVELGSSWGYTQTSRLVPVRTRTARTTRRRGDNMEDQIVLG
jgi:hypothetical protein